MSQPATNKTDTSGACQIEPEKFNANDTQVSPSLHLTPTSSSPSPLPCQGQFISTHPLLSLSNDVLFAVIVFCDFETINSMVSVPILAAQVFIDSCCCYQLWELGQLFADAKPWIKDECVGTWLLSDCPKYSPGPEVSLPCESSCSDEWKMDLFTNICGPQRGLYCFLRHVLGMTAEVILSMTTGEVLTKMAWLDGIVVDMDTMMAAQFYGLNNLACSLFEAMDLRADQFVRGWELLLVTGNRHFSRRSNCKHLWQNVFSMIDGRDPLASMFVHGNKYLVRQIWARYGDEDGVVWCNGASIFARSMHLAFDSLSFNEDWAILRKNWRFHLCNNPRAAFELCNIFVRATHPSSFHMWHQIYLLTGSLYALSRLRERSQDGPNSNFGLKHLRLLSRDVLNHAKLTDFLELHERRGSFSNGDVGLQAIADTEKYPFEIGCHKTEKYYYTAVKGYLTEEYIELHSQIHTLVFRV